MDPNIRTGWEIYYTDLTVYNNASGTWGSAPSGGVLIVVELDNHHKEVHMGMDYYYMDPIPSGTIGHYMEAEKDDYNYLPSSGSKVGNWTDQATWNTVHNNIFGV